MAEFYKSENLNDRQLLEIFTHFKLQDYPSVTMLEELRDELTKRGYEIEDTIIEIRFKNKETYSLVKMSNKKGTLEVNVSKKEEENQ